MLTEDEVNVVGVGVDHVRAPGATEGAGQPGGEGETRDVHVTLVIIVRAAVGPGAIHARPPRMTRGADDSKQLPERLFVNKLAVFMRRLTSKGEKKESQTKKKKK